MHNEFRVVWALFAYVMWCHWTAVLVLDTQDAHFCTVPTIVSHNTHKLCLKQLGLYTGPLYIMNTSASVVYTKFFLPS